MKDYSELSKWLQDDITKPAVIRNGDFADTIIRVPYDDDFADIGIRLLFKPTLEIELVVVDAL